MGTIGRNGAEVIGNKHEFYSADHGEAGATVSIRDMGDARGGNSAGSGRNAVKDDLHRETAGKRSTVGRIVTNN